VHADDFFILLILLTLFTLHRRFYTFRQLASGYLSISIILDYSNDEKDISESFGISNTGDRDDLNNSESLDASQMFRNPLCRCVLIAIILQQSQTVKIKKPALFITTYLRKNRMFDKLRTLFAVLIIIICGAANADLAAVAYADYEGIVNGEEQKHAMQSMDVMLNENVYEIQQETSKMKFRVDSPIGDIWASFREFEGGFMMLNSDLHHAMASIDINAESLDTDGGLIGVMLKGESFFDVENFPSMRFVGSSFEWYSDRRAVLKGYMTIKNVTRQVAFYVELVDADVENTYSERITVKASTTIKRSEFGIYTLLPAVSDNVNLFMCIEARKKNTSISMK